VRAHVTPGHGLLGVAVVVDDTICVARDGRDAAGEVALSLLISGLDKVARLKAYAVYGGVKGVIRVVSCRVRLSVCLRLSLASENEADDSAAFWLGLLTCWGRDTRTSMRFCGRRKRR
jgi:hypothetical protein